MAKKIDYMAENDAYTLMLYQELVNDKARMNRAIKAAKKQADDLTARASALRKVGKK